MNATDIVLCSLASAAVAGLAWLGLGLARARRDDGERDMQIGSATIDMVALAAVVTFVAMAIARHPEWVS
ncbi:MAG: hypothetical protein EOP13_11835 [Pseudomonas sp.]|jgi:hypothetical protein|uniref:hypothetical protein n=1 Tax=Pseudomonas sp. TaxID=306 RepID=UPI0012148CB1|nr:hypothetical protein [Pseudomonas sp.]RZI73443.1 MAG: hypothetical protein EOP13_11835 [Pseudomonas sp.]